MATGTLPAGFGFPRWGISFKYRTAGMPADSFKSKTINYINVVSFDMNNEAEEAEPISGSGYTAEELSQFVTYLSALAGYTSTDINANGRFPLEV